jgi:hypothetical protein
MDAPIMTELREKVESWLAHLHQLIKAQAQGQSGPLLTKGYANVAYIIGDDGNLWAVCALWDSGNRGWHVDATSIENPYEWHVGIRVLSQV